jgi:hypothetical protein
LQSQLEELRARQDELQEAHRRELAAALAARDEAHRRHMEAQQQHTQRQISDLVGYFQSIQSSTAPPLPASLFAPPPVPPPVPAPAGSPVSVYMFVYCFGLCGRPADTNEFAFILCSISRGVRTRPLLQGVGGRLLLMATQVRSTRGLVPIRSTATPGCPAALLRAPGTRTRTRRCQGRPCGRRGQVRALHTLGGTHPGRLGQMGARDTTEATATTGQSHSTRGEALATSRSDIHVDLWFML